MKILKTSLLLICLGAFPVRGASIEDRLAELENKVKVLESAVSEKLGDCQLTYKRHSLRSNFCDKGTFARSVQFINSSVMNLECGYYQLSCNKN